MPTEFEFIRNIRKKYGLGYIGDDCAVLPKDSTTDLLITADLLVEGVDFRLEWAPPELIGHKSLAVSLSDIAAMGGTPQWAMLSIGIPANIWNGKFVDKFYEGWFALAKRFGVELIGGDVSRTPANVVIDSVVAGEVKKERAVLRSGARPGDSIFGTGSLGGAAMGLDLLETGISRTKARGRKQALIARQLAPTPRVDIGKYLVKQNLATSMIDISDGLAADLYHLCDASNVGAEISLDSIPIDENIETSRRTEAAAFAIGGGEDFELLFTSKRRAISNKKFPPMTRIGEITSNVGIVELVDRNGAKILPDLGYKHF